MPASARWLLQKSVPGCCHDHAGCNKMVHRERRFFIISVYLTDQTRDRPTEMQYERFLKSSRWKFRQCPIYQQKVDLEPESGDPEESLI
jgi:hypothetical protein